VAEFVFGQLIDDDHDVITAADVRLRIMRDSDDSFYDFDDGGNDFSTTTWGSVESSMSEVNEDHMSGYYTATVDITTWADGNYTLHVDRDDATPHRRGTLAVTVKDGVLLEDAIHQGVIDASGHIVEAKGTIDTNLDATISSRSSHTAAGAADAVWDETLTDHLGVGAAGKQLLDASGVPEIIADAVWEENLWDHTDDNSAGQTLIDASGNPTDMADAVWASDASVWRGRTGTTARYLYLALTYLGGRKVIEEGTSPKTVIYSDPEDKDTATTVVTESATTSGTETTITQDVNA
jgi:hypothetical protein